VLEDPPVWDQNKADELVGLYVLVGITSVEADGQTVISQSQYHGRIVSADPKGFKVECEGTWKGQVTGLPPHISVIEPATPGKYTLHSTGETVENPDLLARWTVIERATS
jgi:hypothetical protein